MVDAVVFPHAVNWREPVSLTYAALTEIHLSRSGREQRVGWREVPRKTMTFEALMTEENRRRFVRLLAKRQSKLIVAAESPRRTKLAADAAATDTEIEVETVPEWMTEGAYLVLNDGSQWEYVEIASLAGTTLTLADPLAYAWSAGVRVYFGVLGRLSDVQAAELTNGVWTAPVTVDAEPGVQSVEASGEAASTFNGREIFPFAVNWKSEPDSNFDYPVDRIDYGRGRIAVTDTVDFGSRTRRFEVLGKTWEQSEEIRRFFWRMNGQQGEFYASTGSNDLPLMTGVGSGSTTFTVAGEETADAYGDDTVHKAVSIRLKDGTVINREVTSVTVSGGNSLVTLTAALGTAISPSTVAAISWMLVWRLASDQITVEWQTDSVATASFTAVTLEALEPE